MSSKAPDILLCFYHEKFIFKVKTCVVFLKRVLVFGSIALYWVYLFSPVTPDKKEDCMLGQPLGRPGLRAACSLFGAEERKIRATQKHYANFGAK